MEKSKKTSNDLLQEKVVPQFVKNSEGGGNDESSEIIVEV